MSEREREKEREREGVRGERVNEDEVYGKYTCDIDHYVNIGSYLVLSFLYPPIPGEHYQNNASQI